MSGIEKLIPGVKFKFTQVYSGMKDHSTGIVKRMIGTIKHLVQKYLALKNTTKYIDVLDHIVHNYNHTEHCTIRNTPADAISTLRAYQETPENLYRKYKQNELKEGDKVRLIQVSKFKKINDPTWSHEIYDIEKKIGYRYKLKGDDTLYARYHLRQTSKPSEIEQGYYKDLQNTAKEQKKEKEMKKIGIENKNLKDILVEPRILKRDKYVIYSNKIKYADRVTFQKNFAKRAFQINLTLKTTEIIWLMRSLLI